MSVIKNKNWATRVGSILGLAAGVLLTGLGMVLRINILFIIGVVLIISGYLLIRPILKESVRRRSVD